MLNHVVSDCEQQIPLLEAEAKEVNNSIEKERSRERNLQPTMTRKKIHSIRTLAVRRAS